jgi:DUF971 family protein
MSTNTPVPTRIRLHRRSRQLELTYADGTHFDLPCEYLRVYSPSAEVRGHGPGQEVLLVGKESVAITSIEPVGHYAVRLIFDDGHNSGLYSWDYLHELGARREENWQDYLDRLREVGYKRRDQNTDDAP